MSAASEGAKLISNRAVAKSTSLVDSHVKQIERLYVDLIAEADGLLERWQDSLGKVRRGR